MRTHTQESQSSLTPAMALQILKEGNARFVANLKVNRNLLQQMNETKEGQWPFACVLFSIRVAGNVLNTDILGSMEFACKVAGSKTIAVLGHTHCGAIKGACTGVKMGNLTALLEKITPIVEKQRLIYTSPDCTPEMLVEMVAERHVREVIKSITRRSSILREMVENGEIIISGGIYNVETGVIDFFD
jgi:carbonic anhydrase